MNTSQGMAKLTSFLVIVTSRSGSRSTRYSLQLRWRSLPPRKAALAAPRAAGMPVRRPRRPAAVSAADAAGAGPELGCAGQLERAAEAPIDEASSLWVGLSVDRSVDRSGLVRRSISRLGLRLVGSSVRAGALCFRGLGIRIFFVSALVCVRRSVCGCVSVRLLAQFLRRGTPLFFPSVLSFVLVCARAVMGSAGVVLASASASAESSGGCCWWERSRAHARVLSSVFWLA